MISLTLGITTAAVGGITGVGAVLGLVGFTIKGGIETAVAAYQAFRNVEKRQRPDQSAGGGDRIAGRNGWLAKSLAKFPVGPRSKKYSRSAGTSRPADIERNSRPTTARYRACWSTPKTWARKSPMWSASRTRRSGARFQRSEGSGSVKSCAQKQRTQKRLPKRRPSS